MSRKPIVEHDENSHCTPSLVTCFWCERLHPGDRALSVCPECAARYSTMRTLEMCGSYPLEVESIDRLITRTSAGNYALGYMVGDEFSVFYVGRSDSDLKRRLHQWVDTPSRDKRYPSAAHASWGVRHRTRFPIGAPALARVGSARSAYTRFAFSYAHSAEEAYAKECRNYDAFGGRRGLDNEREPFFGHLLNAPDGADTISVQTCSGAPIRSCL